MNKKQNRLVRHIYRREDINVIEHKLNLLGSHTKLDAITFMNLRLTTTLIIFTAVLLFTNPGFFYAPVISIIYYSLFQYILIDSRIKRRNAKLDHEALYFFEILTLTLESGRNLENALEMTIANVDSELSQEFKKVLIEMRLGKSLNETLEDLRHNIPSDTINNIILNITQTNIFGNSILDTMYSQIDFLRDKQILEIKGKINKLPNKISIISVVFIVPLILLIILGPLFINFIG